MAKIAVTVWQKALAGKFVLSRERAKRKEAFLIGLGRQLNNRMVGLRGCPVGVA